MKPLYVVDTNVLVDWARHVAPELDAEPPTPGARAWRERCARFCTATRQDVAIPDLVWVELHGVITQKGLDQADYDGWLTARKQALRAIHDAVFREDSHLTIVSGAPDVELAVDLCYAPVAQSLLARAAGAAPGRPAKLLDGIDSALLAFAWRQAEQTSREVVLTSGDRGLLAVLAHLREVHRLGSRVVPLNLRGQAP